MNKNMKRPTRNDVASGMYRTQPDQLGTHRVDTHAAAAVVRRNRIQRRRLLKAALTPKSRDYRRWWLWRKSRRWESVEVNGRIGMANPRVWRFETKLVEFPNGDEAMVNLETGTINWRKRR